MRRDCLPYLIDKTGKHSEMQRLHFKDKKIAESYLQEIINASPIILPVDRLDSDYHPLVSIGREIANIDNLLISPTGKLTIVETKLWRNPQATREVLAQLMEYANLLWGMEYDEFQELGKSALAPAPLKNMTLHELVTSAYPKETLDEAEFHDEVQKCLNNAEFMLLIVGDGIRENIEGLTDLIHRPQMHFKFGLVELQIYESSSTPHRLIIPNIIAHATEIRRTVIKIEGGTNEKISVKYEEPKEKKSRRVLSEDEFFSLLEDKGAADLFKELLAFGDELGASRLWRASSVTIYLPDPNGSRQGLSLYNLGINSSVSTSFLQYHLRLLSLDESIALERAKQLSLLFGIPTDKKYTDELSEYISWKKMNEHLNDFKSLINETVERIKESAEKTKAQKR